MRSHRHKFGLHREFVKGLPHRILTDDQIEKETVIPVHRYGMSLKHAGTPKKKHSNRLHKRRK